MQFAVFTLEFSTVAYFPPQNQFSLSPAMSFQGKSYDHRKQRESCQNMHTELGML